METKKCLSLFSSFFKIGAFTFGGGYAMLALIEKETCEKKKWINEKEMIDIIAISESTPGPIAINTATFIGYKTAGVLGSLFATLGVVLPSYIVISAISIFYDAFKNLTIINSAFCGIRVCVVILMLNALLKLSKQAQKNTVSIIITAVSFLIATFTNIDVIFVIILAGIVGLFTPITKGGNEL